MLRSLVALLVLAASAAWGAGPYLVCDPPPPGEVRTHYDILKTPTGTPIRTPAPLHYDVAGTPAGPIAWQIRSVNVDPIRGEATSDYVPFADPWLSKPTSPGGVRLSGN